MSKHIEWSEMYGEGIVVVQCEQCSSYDEYQFEDNFPDYKGVSNKAKLRGWKSVKIDGEWYDFCCEKCRNKYIKNNT